MLVILCICVLIIVLYFTCVKRERITPISSDDATPTSLAAKLSAADASCFGTAWCGFTKKQLEEVSAVSASFKYVDCEEHADACKDAGINAYPTWMINGKKHEGFMSSQRLEDVC